MNERQTPPKRKKTASLRFLFVASVFGLLLLTSILLAPLSAALLHFGLFERNPVAPLLVLFIASLVIGTALSGFVYRRILQPITKISEASQKVASGDFTVRLDETHRINEIQDIYGSFNAMVDELNGIETLRNDFVVNVSHEFKNPLAAIEGCTTLLQDETATPEERQEYAQMILDSTRQLGTLTGNILKLSKLESSGMPLEKQSYQLDEQLRQAVLLLENEWSQKGLELDVDLDTAFYTGNEELLMQVWLNLLGNAIKFTPQGGKIGVALYKTTGGVSVQITDNGVGMSEQACRHAFEKFYQGNAARNGEGNGLGLALVQRIVQQHGGSVEVKSTEGKGSVFTVRLP